LWKQLKNAEKHSGKGQVGKKKKELSASGERGAGNVQKKKTLGSWDWKNSR